MPKSLTVRLTVAALLVAVGAGLAVLLAHESGEPQTRKFDIRARQYAYDPPIIEVNLGDTVSIYLSSIDVVHGFYLEGHGIDAEIYPLEKTFRLRDETATERYRKVEEIVFVASKVGKFRYRCSHTCGYLHPFMQGELIVGPNYPYQAATGAAVGLLLAGGFLLLLKAHDKRRTIDVTAREKEQGRVAATDKLSSDKEKSDAG